MTAANTETAMAKEWREQLEASRRLRSDYIPDRQVPGMFWSPAMHAKQETR